MIPATADGCFKYLHLNNCHGLFGVAGDDDFVTSIPDVQYSGAQWRTQSFMYEVELTYSRWQKSGNDVAVSLQLADAMFEFEYWAELYTAPEPTEVPIPGFVFLFDQPPSCSHC